MKKARTQKQMSDAAVKERTGKVWSEWYEILDQAGAKKWQHQEKTAFLEKTHKGGGGVGQNIAVPYEHARGLREKFQKCTGEFSASGSRTLNVPMAKLYEAWTDEKLRRRWLPGAKMEITTATPNKSLRAKWDQGQSRLSVNFYPKGAGKAQAAAAHIKLAGSKESERRKNSGL